jgi:hypothetical protein
MNTPGTNYRAVLQTGFWPPLMAWYSISLRKCFTPAAMSWASKSDFVISAAITQAAWRWQESFRLRQKVKKNQCRSPKRANQNLERVTLSWVSPSARAYTVCAQYVHITKGSKFANEAHMHKLSRLAAVSAFTHTSMCDTFMIRTSSLSWKRFMKKLRTTLECQKFTKMDFHTSFFPKESLHARVQTFVLACTEEHTNEFFAWHSPKYDIMDIARKRFAESEKNKKKKPTTKFTNFIQKRKNCAVKIHVCCWFLPESVSSLPRSTRFSSCFKTMVESSQNSCISSTFYLFNKALNSLLIHIAVSRAHTTAHERPGSYLAA